MKILVILFSFFFSTLALAASPETQQEGGGSTATTEDYGDVGGTIDGSIPTFPTAEEIEAGKSVGGTINTTPSPPASTGSVGGTLNDSATTTEGGDDAAGGDGFPLERKILGAISKAPIAVGVRMNALSERADVTLNTPPGFAMDSTSSHEPELWMNWREGKLALEVGVTPNATRTHEMTFFGTPLCTREVDGPQWSVGGKRYLFEHEKVRPYLGVTFEELNVSGNCGMGGTPFITTGDGWRTMGKVGAEFRIKGNFAITAEYVLDSTDIKVEIPGGGGSANIETGGQLLIGVTIHTDAWGKTNP